MFSSDSSININKNDKKSLSDVTTVHLKVEKNWL